MQIRHFYSYLCVFGKNGNWQWNCRLAKQFNVSDRTVRRWLAWLKNKNLVWIESPYGNQRKIHVHYYKNAVQWLTSIPFSQATKDTKEIQYHKANLKHRKRHQIRQLLKT